MIVVSIEIEEKANRNGADDLPVGKAFNYLQDIKRYDNKWNDFSKHQFI